MSLRGKSKCTVNFFYEKAPLSSCPYFQGKKGSRLLPAVRPGSIDPMTAVVQRVKGFVYYSLSFSRHNKNIKMEHFFLLYILSRYFNLTP